MELSLKLCNGVAELLRLQMAQSAQLITLLSAVCSERLQHAVASRFPP
jgi:hypothetical protein